MFGYLPTIGRFQRGRSQSPAAGTPLAVLIAPMAGAYTHVNELVVGAGSTAHTIWLLRPFNYTTLANTASAGQAVVSLSADPTKWNTSYQYPLLNSGPNGTPVGNSPPLFQVANGTIVANDYFVFETQDGAFYFDYVASVAALNVTLAHNLPTGGLLQGAKAWYMGQPNTSYLDPANGLPPWNYTTTASSQNKLPFVNDGEIYQSLHPYDPILFYDANATVADTLESLGGYYAKF